MPGHDQPLPLGTRALAGAFLASGLTHLVRPELFEPLVPRRLPARRALVLGSGAAEIACGVGLITRQRWAPAASAALLIAVWPGNWTMAIAWQRSDRIPAAAAALAWARVPLQLPMIAAALRSPTR